MGKVGDLDVSQASGSLNVAQAELRLMQGLYSEARRGLEVLVGRYPAAELEVAAAFVPVPPPVGAGLPSSLLARRPDLVAAERQVLAAFRTQEAARLALRPSFGLGLGGGRLSDGVLSLLRLNPWMIRAALGMLVPFYQGGALRAQVKITTAQQEQAVARYGGVALGAFREVEDALTNEQLLAERAEFEQQALADHTETVRIANIQYAAGATDMHSVLQFQAQQIASEAELIKLGRTRLVNRINLHLGLGGSFDAAPATAAATATPPEGGQPVR
jgi:outer membrane protein TolC